jgi:hypothetical protein
MPTYARPMVVAKEKGMANQVRPPEMKPHTPYVEASRRFKNLRQLILLLHIRRMEVIDNDEHCGPALYRSKNALKYFFCFFPRNVV